MIMIMVVAMVAAGLTIYMNRTPPGKGEDRDRQVAEWDQARPKPWRRMKGPKLWRSGTEYCRALSSDHP